MATALGEVKSWRAETANDLVEVEIACADGNPYKALAPGDIKARLERLAKPTSRLRILNPFDPAVRDRKRLARLFGLDFRIEIFVPAAQRKWGYYVMPILARLSPHCFQRRGALRRIEMLQMGKAMAGIEAVVAWI